ncbi:IS110 family transposase [candidate division KSB1 bacterium]
MRKIMDYIVKDNDIFIGFEDSRRNWKLCVRSHRQIVHEISLPAEYENLRSYLQRNYPGCKIKLMYEAGFSGFWLHDLLAADGIECIVTPANRVTMEKVNAVKTDKRDARRLARNLENGDYVRCHVPDRERREDRQVSRTLEQIQRDITRTKNRIRRLLDCHGLNIGLPAGRWKRSDYAKLDRMQLDRSLKVSLDSYLRQLKESEEIKQVLTEELRLLYKKERYKRAAELKASCPGIGWFTAIRLTLEWGAMDRFPTKKKLASYTGLTCREYSTGETTRKGRITGQSSKSVRSWLIQCAWTAVKRDVILREKFNNVWRNSGSKKKAIVAVARKLAIRMRALEITDTKYCLGVIE